MSSPANRITLDTSSFDRIYDKYSTPEQLIPLLRSSLKAHLDFLDKAPSIYEISGNQPSKKNNNANININNNNNNNDRHFSKKSLPGTVSVEMHPQSKELDTSIDMLLNYVGYRFSKWIFDDFIDSTDLQQSLWHSFFYYAIKSYERLVLNKRSTAAVANENKYYHQQVYQVGNKRYENLCTTVKSYYRQFICQLIEKFGTTPSVNYVVSRLDLCPKAKWVRSIVSQKSKEILHTSIHNALCWLGDLSRYCASFEHQCFESTSSYWETINYYTVASNFAPSSGVPLNQLGNTHYMHGDMYAATCYFLRSVAVEHPFSEQKNFKLILHKFSKLDQSAFSKMSMSDLDDLAFKTSHEMKQVKKIMFLVLQFYSHVYLAQMTGAAGIHIGIDNPNALFGFRNVQVLQKHIAENFYVCFQTCQVPEKAMVNLVITLIIFNWLLEKAVNEERNEYEEGKKDGRKFLTPFKAYHHSLTLSLNIFINMLTLALEHMDSEALDDNRKLPTGIVPLLPALRIIFDWTYKQLLEGSVDDWLQNGIECHSFFAKLWEFVACLQKKHGYQFDICTAVACSNLDRFVNVFPNQPNTFASVSAPAVAEAEVVATSALTTLKKSADNKEMRDSRNSSSPGLGNSSSKDIVEVYEETCSIGLVPLNNGLSDIPSGLKDFSDSEDFDINEYRIQCILFSGIEIGRLPDTFLIVDNSQGSNSTFQFKLVEVKSHVRYPEETVKYHKSRNILSAYEFTDFSDSDESINSSESSECGETLQVEDLGKQVEHDYFDNVIINSNRNNTELTETSLYDDTNSSNSSSNSSIYSSELGLSSFEKCLNKDSVNSVDMPMESTEGVGAAALRSANKKLLDESLNGSILTMNSQPRSLLPNLVNMEKHKAKSQYPNDSKHEQNEDDISDDDDRFVTFKNPGVSKNGATSTNTEKWWEDDEAEDDEVVFVKRR